MEQLFQGFISLNLPLIQKGVQCDTKDISHAISMYIKEGHGKSGTKTRYLSKTGRVI